MTQTFILELVSKPECIEKIIASFDVMRNVKGFEKITIYQDPDQPTHLICIEVWDSKASHKKFFDETKTETSAEWLALLETPPKAKFFDCVKILESEPL